MVPKTPPKFEGSAVCTYWITCISVKVYSEVLWMSEQSTMYSSSKGLMHMNIDIYKVNANEIRGYPLSSAREKERERERKPFAAKYDIHYSGHAW